MATQFWLLRVVVLSLGPGKQACQASTLQKARLFARMTRENDSFKQLCLPALRKRRPLLQAHGTWFARVVY